MKTYIVITKVHPDDEYDDLLVSRPTVIGWESTGRDLVEDVFHEYDSSTDTTDYSRLNTVRVKLPVFTLGEILIVNEHGREIIGRGRKPDKWYVQYEEFFFLRSAIKRAKALQEYQWA